MKAFLIAATFFGGPAPDSAGSSVYTNVSPAIESSSVRDLERPRSERSDSKRRIPGDTYKKR